GTSARRGHRRDVAAGVQPHHAGDERRRARRRPRHRSAHRPRAARARHRSGRSEPVPRAGGGREALMRLAAHGVNLALRSGWEGRIMRRDAVEPDGERTYAVVHLATFPMPEQRGDFGGGVTELMRSPDALVILFEYGPESIGTALFSTQGI